MGGISRQVLALLACQAIVVTLLGPFATRSLWSACDPLVPSVQRQRLRNSPGGLRPGSASSGPSDLVIPPVASAVYEISSDLTRCSSSSTHASHQSDSSQRLPVVSGKLPQFEFLCALQCAEDEPALEAALQQWWDSPVEPGIFDEVCRRVGEVTQVMLGVIHLGDVYLKCCSTGSFCNHETKDADMRNWIGILQELAGAVELPTIQFVLNGGDEPFTSKTYFSSVPMLHWTGSTGYWTIPFPNPYHLQEVATGYQPERAGVRDWGQRRSVAWWRGGFTAQTTSYFASRAALPRLRLFRLAKQRPDLFDVAYSEVDDLMDRQWGADAVASAVGPKVGPEFYEPIAEVGLRVKYVINVAGVISSWRLTNILPLGVVLLQQHDETFEHLQPLLEPWVHFVPVREDLSDLIPLLDYLRSHDNLARNIAEASRDLWRRRMRAEDTYCYIYRAMMSIHRVTGQQEIWSRQKLEKEGYRLTVPVQPEGGDQTGQRGEMGAFVPLSARVELGLQRWRQ
mmetsp:Transcript_35258/g.77154  ORF Transcript_35258/g.77154 Transcript_35258/m.77154 type:complete len:511 (-) Transcript_35258:40-1572(-)